MYEVLVSDGRTVKFQASALNATTSGRAAAAAQFAGADEGARPARGFFSSIYRVAVFSIVRVGPDRFPLVATRAGPARTRAPVRLAAPPRHGTRMVRGRVAATPRLPRGYSAAAAAARTVRVPRGYSEGGGRVAAPPRVPRG